MFCSALQSNIIPVLSGSSDMRRTKTNQKAAPIGYPLQLEPNRFVMVFACLMLSVFATIDAYEQTASEILFYMVSLLVE